MTAEHRPLWIVAALLALAAAAQWGAAQVPIALLCLAAIAAVLALSGWARRVLGVVIGLVAVGAALNGHWLAIAGGVLMLASSVLLVVRGHHVPKIGMGGQKARAADPERDMWQALERGDDPTDTKE